MAKFYIRTNKSTGEAPLYVRIQRLGKNIMLNTHVNVDIEKWKRANSSASAWQKFVGNKYGFDINNMLTSISAVIDSCTASNKLESTYIQKCIDDVVFAPVRRSQEQAAIDEANKRRKEIEQRDSSIPYFIERLIKGMEDGTIRNKGNRYEYGTVKAWKVFRNMLMDFYNTNPFTWDDIDSEFIDNFVSWLENKKGMKQTINKHLKCFRAFVNKARKMGIHNNTTASMNVYYVRVNEDDKKTEISLTANELRALYEMPLVGIDAVYRDVFLCGCYTCQRYSDFSQLKEYNFTTTAKGTKVVKLEQKKTKKVTVVPVLNDNLLKIAQKYNFNIPYIEIRKLNQGMRDIAKRLSETVPSLAEEVPTVLSVYDKENEKNELASFTRDEFGRTFKHRYDMISSHTARRTGITSLYLSGKFDNVQMMSISGHKDVKTFLNYIRLSKDEMADTIASKAREEENTTNEGLF